MPRPAKPNAKHRSARLRGWRGRVVLLAFSVLVSALVLAALEGAARLAGYGGYPPTFDKVGTLDDGSTLVMTQHAGPGSYFFSTRSRAGSLDPTAFAMPKPANTVRIVVAGGSAAKGSPWPRHLAAASFLEQMLQDCYPGKRVEVINIGTTAIASYPVLGMTTEALDYDPDLVVAYLGNNEFYGAYGVASLHSAGRSPAMIRLIRATRSLGVAQFLDAQRQGYDTSDPRTLMEAMVGRASIAPNDPARGAAARNLETFVGDLIDRCKARGVPVVVCPPPCNEAGLAPLGTPDRSAMDPDAREQLEAALAEADAALAHDDPATARDAARRAIVIEPNDARAHFLLGQTLAHLGDPRNAAAEFRAAVDLDPMPWRPPSASVDAVRSAARNHGAVLCDLPTIFRAASPDGAVGWDLMADHVHPTLRGEALIARSIVRVMDQLPAPVHVAPKTAVNLAPDETYTERLCLSVYDEYAAAHAMRTLGKIPFFAQSNPGFYDRFDAQCREIEAGSPAPVVAELHAWQDPASHKGEWRPVTGMVAQAVFGQGDYRGPSRSSMELGAVTPYGSWELPYTAVMLICRAQLPGGLTEQDRAIALDEIERGRFVIRNGWSTTGAAERYTGEMLALVGNHDQAIATLLAGRAKLPQAAQVAVDGDLVRSYLAIGRFDEADAVARAGIDAAGRYSPYYLQMAEQVRAAKGGG
ncbi:MAG: hypothetical protein R3B49_11495 [Phycisphaerales bacterium]